MSLVRIQEADILNGFLVRLTLTNGTIIERDIGNLLTGPIFDSIRTDPQMFRQLRVHGGTLVWANGADLCPDVLIWGGAPPQGDKKPPSILTLEMQN
ncbi:MAG: DUF2442 domain-containing protein [Nitrospira sp.]|nr:DUF2442 domain-containing protein [Nitrospira sp.]